MHEAAQCHKQKTVVSVKFMGCHVVWQTNANDSEEWPASIFRVGELHNVFGDKGIVNEAKNK